MRTITKYSEELKTECTLQEVAKDTWIIKTADGVLYTQGEINALKERGQKTPLQVHLLKKVFKGTVVSGKS